MRPEPLNVLFRVAAGPRVGFGHLTRCRSLARALGVRAQVSIRGSLATRNAAASFGWSVVHRTHDAWIRELGLDLAIVDDPSREDGQQWVSKAHRLGVPVASVHDLGTAVTTADLLIDGTIQPIANRVARPALRGPKFAILDPAIAQLRARRMEVVPRRVVIALGGGRHVYALAKRLTRAIAGQCGDVDVRVACGFAAPAQLPVLATGHWFTAPDGLGESLGSAAVAIVGGGMTAYEACALGVPAIGVALTAAQHATIRALACRGALLDAGWPISESVVDRIASVVAAMLSNETLRARLSRDAAKLIDGQGAMRVADRLRQLAAGEVVDAA
jgi:spore coat polysaccharide biosynthesis predicted glycosyltransferase SpsG